VQQKFRGENVYIKIISNLAEMSKLAAAWFVPALEGGTIFNVELKGPGDVFK
jgi:hypothetical protein